MVDHQLLLNRLRNSFAVTGTALDWIHSYLNGRFQRVKVGHFQSPNNFELSMGVPQGSVLGPLLFSAYISPVGALINSFGVGHQQYADDTQLFISLAPADSSASMLQLENSLYCLHAWFCLNGLALNPDKSDAIWFSTTQRLRTLSPAASVDVAGSAIDLSETIKVLGVTLDTNLTFNQHVSSVCKSANYHIRALRHIRASLTDEMAKSIAVALVSSRLDYANSVLYGTSQANLHKLQRVQNTLAKLTVNNKQLSSDQARAYLHWLPVKHRITFKLAMLTYKVSLTNCPGYLANLISPYQPTRCLRSAGHHLLTLPRVSSAIGSKAFSIAAPSVWNRLPDNLRAAPSLTTFKRLLKTHLFTRTD